MPNPDAIVLPEVNLVEVRLDPVQIIINSMVLLIRSEELSGLNPWIYETVAAIEPEVWERHNLVLDGLHYAVTPTRAWKDFPSYLENLKKADPVSLRDKVLDFYIDFEPCELDGAVLTGTKESLLEDEDFFLEYVTGKFGAELINREVEKKSYALLNNPSEMKELITGHLEFMWDEYYRKEWEHMKPMLEDTVLAFEGTDFSTMEKDEIVKYITGKDATQEFWAHCKENDALVFVPSTHNGPYIGKFVFKNTHGVIFAARLPVDTKVDAPDLSRNEITIRLTALADDIRLNILRTIAEQGELKSQEIMDRLELSQSAASRHLKQLSATGYLTERRCSGAKCYSLNADKVQDTLGAVAAFLLCD